MTSINQILADRRRQILEELICEYLDDNEYTPRRIYEELLSVLANEVQGREEASKKAIEVRELLLVYRPMEFPNQFEV